MFGRLLSSVFKFAAGGHPPSRTDDKVIDVEFREKKN
jgi:hypothetical protein